MLYKKIDQEKIQCLACNHYCKLKKGQVGICGVRQNLRNRINVLIYGRPSAINVDPIEKKPLYHFLPGTDVLSIGSFGCNFGCAFCQNWTISQFKQAEAFATVEYVSPQDLVKSAAKYPSLAFTYNEPTIWTEYALDAAKLAKKKKIKMVYVSNGYMSKECREALAPYLAAVNIDLKSFSDEFYMRTCGARLKPVLESIKFFNAARVWTEVTTLIVPGQNDSKRELREIADFLAGVNKNIPWHISAFHGDYKMKGHKSTPMNKLLEAYDIGKKAGLNYVYVGNVHAGKYGNTNCPNCHELLIERGYMSAKIKNMTRGKCIKCGEKIAGVYV